MMIRFKYLLLAGILSSSNFYAEEPRVELEEVTLTGEKSDGEEPHRTEYPYHVTVIEVDPQKTQNMSLQELLQEQVSLQVSSFGGRASYSTMSIRGALSSQVKVFMDGIEINRGDSQSVDLSTLDLRQFERVEIYRSHAPAQFGTGAMGGVVNLVSKKSSRKHNGNLKLGVGSYGYYESQLNTFLNHHKMKHRLYVSYEESEGDFDFVDDNLTPDNPIDDKQKTRINNDYKALRLGWFGQNEWNEQHKLSWNLTYFDRDKGLAGPAKFQSDEVRCKEEHVTFQLNYHLNKLYSDRDTTKMYLGFHHLQDQYLDRQSNLGLGAQDSEYPTQSQTIGLFHKIENYPFNHNFNLSYKKERQQALDNLASQYAPINKRDKTNLGYDLDYFFWEDKFELSASAATSFIKDAFQSSTINQNTDRNIWTWGLGIRYQHNSNIAIKSSISKGLRIPSFGELFGDRGTTQGNDQLVPEKSLNYDLGFELKKDELLFFKSLRLESSIFRSERDQLIQMVVDTRGVGRAMNIGDGEIEGFEIKFKTDLDYGFSLSQDYTYLKPIVTKANLAGGQGKKIPEIYETSWTPKLSWSKQNFSCSYSILIEQGQYYDIANFIKSKDKELHNMNISYAYKKFHFSFDLNNLTDEQYEDFNNWPLAGRSLIFSVLSHY